MQVGTAWAEITPHERLTVAGQNSVRYGEYTHDPLTANAVAFDDGVTKAVLVSCDLLWLEEAFVRELQAACAARYGLPPGRILFACTHTHLAPCTGNLLPGEMSPAYMASLREMLLSIVGEALTDLEPADLFAGVGWVDQMGFNRRGRRADGTAAMYLGSWSDDFAEVEGPRDGQVPVVFARRPGGELKVVIPSFASHPNSVENESYYSADFVGAIRQVLRRNLGDDVGIAYLTGAGGNTAPSQLEGNPGNRQPWRGEEGWQRSGLYLGAEILKVIAATADPMPGPVLRVAGTTAMIPMRPWHADFDADALPAGGQRDRYVAARDAWAQMMREESPVPTHLNVLRIGDAAICTNPAEFFVEHGLAIKQGSPARVTLISELTDGYVGYVPTVAAFAGGGYETLPAHTSKLIPEAGEIMVPATRRLLAEAFGD
jgi:neutral ceramidase